MASEGDHGFRKGEKPRGRRDGNSDHRDRKRSDDRGHGERRSSRGDRPRRGDGSGREDRPRRNERRDNGRGERKDFRRDGDRPRRDRDGPPRERSSRRESYPKEPVRRPKIISNDPQKLLFRGVELQSKGENDEALLLFIHGSVLMSKGCENNALRLLDDIGERTFADVRESIAFDCSEDALIEFDYLCKLKDTGYDPIFLEQMYSEGKCHAIYRKILLGDVEGDDPIIDVFVGNHDDPRVNEGLRYLVKKKDSERAAKQIESLKERDSRRQYVHTAFTRAMKGDKKALRDLEGLTSEFREARFFYGYIKAYEEDDGIPWLKENFDEYGDLIISEGANLRIEDTPYGMYLRAKKIQSKKEDWVPSMIKAAKYGSEEAMEELMPLKRRTDIRKAIADIHLRNGDLDGLIDDYVDGLEETQYLDKYCENVPARIVNVGKRIGEIKPMREIDWLRAHAFMAECRDALVVLAKDERYHSRKLLFALHDVGKNIEAADLYFEMEGSKELPAIKWLQKVCRDEDAKEHIRQHYESIGDTETFDFIFEDDGYRSRSFFKGRKKRF